MSLKLGKFLQQNLARVLRRKNPSTFDDLALWQSPTQFYYHSSRTTNKVLYNLFWSYIVDSFFPIDN